MDAPSIAVHKFQVRFRDGVFFQHDPVQLVLDVPAALLTITTYTIKFHCLEVSVGFFAHDVTLRDTSTNQLLTIRAHQDIDTFNILRAHLCFLTHVPMGFVPISLLPVSGKTSVFIEAFPQNQPEKRVILKHTRRTDLYYLGISTQEFLAGRNAMKNLPLHPNIANILAVRRTSDALVTVLPKSTATLSDLLSGPVPDTNTSLSIAKDILAAVAHMHAHGVVHRNIAPEHVLIDGHSSPTAMLCGFSNAYRVESEASLTYGLRHKHLSRLPPPNFCAPELSPTTDQPAGPPADVWATGVLLFRLFLRRYPWGRDQNTFVSKNSVFVAITNAANNGESHWHELSADTDLENNLSPDVKSLLSGLLQPIPTRRLSARAALEHPCFTEIQNTHLQQNTPESVANTTVETDTDSDCSESGSLKDQSSTARVSPPVLFKTVARRIRVTKTAINYWAQTTGVRTVAFQLGNSVNTP